ncbi:hypothetical protein diail_1305 [Diaporthe ilicicola]|nr:hypothetical protein diail_1305 [Diaporthe ilicicola]
MAPTKPTILLVQGAWHSPSSYAKLSEALRASGYEVHVPRITSVDGSSPPEGDLETDTALIRSVAEKLIEDGRTVVALMHSYGGQVGTNALHGLGARTREKQGLTGGISHLIYLCAFILPEGWSTYAQAEAIGISQDLDGQLKLTFQEDGNCIMADPRGQLLNNLSDETEAAAYISTLGPWSLKCMTQPLSHCAWKEIPVTYIHTAMDKTVVLSSQQLMVKRIRENGLEDLKIVTLDTDHCPHLTATDDVVGVVKKLSVED